MDRALALMRRVIAVGPLQREIMVKSLRPTADARLLEDINRLCSELESIVNELPPDATFPDPTSIRQQLGDALTWRAMARRKVDDLTGAVEDYERSALLFDGIGRPDMAEKARESISQLRVDEEGHVDDEIRRLTTQLRSLTAGTLSYARTQILIGELLSQHGDDFEARKYLLPAEATLLAISPNPSEESILGDLMKSVSEIEEGRVDPSRPLALVSAMDTRALYQRLYFALARAFRRSDPAASARYEEKLREFARGKRSLTPDELEGLVSGRLSLDMLKRQ